jgi:Xaa-Pro dipeptidase
LAETPSPARGEGQRGTFTEAEYARREQAVAQLCQRDQLDALLIYGTSANARQAQAQVHYLTGFLGHQEAYVLAVPGQQPLLFVQYYNHLPNARRLARGEVRWGGQRSIDAVAEELVRRTDLLRIGMVGPIPYQAHHRIESRFSERTFVDATDAFLTLRLVKSEEELSIMGRAAEVTDAALRALVRSALPDATELELQAAANAAAIRAGGQPHFLYLSSTPMANPNRAVPAQDVTDRRLRRGDAVILEQSSAFGAYSGQVLRTIAIESPLSELYQQLHDVAWQAYHAIAGVIRPGATAQAVIDAADLIERRGFTICDDLLHGYGGGYLPPVLRTRATMQGPVPTFALEANMTIVIQPNVVSADGRAGVQVGELVRMTADGVERLHHLPQRLLIGGELI